MRPHLLHGSKRSVTATGANAKTQRVLWIFCEGSTEEDWINQLRPRATRLGLTVICDQPCGAPMTAVKKAKEQLRVNRRGERRHYSSQDEVYLVLDRDEHPRIKDALEECRRAEIGLIFSNECFELWPLLHTKLITANLSRDILQRQLHEAHPHFHHDRHPYLRWDQLSGSPDEATARALKLHSAIARRPDEDPLQNPFTTAWMLHHRLLRGEAFTPWLADTLRPHAELHDLTSFLPTPLRAEVIRHLTPAKPPPAPR